MRPDALEIHRPDPMGFSHKSRACVFSLLMSTLALIARRMFFLCNAGASGQTTHAKLGKC